MWKYVPAKRKTKNAIKGVLAGLLLWIKNEKPAARRVQAMFGNVKRRRLRRPKVSIVWVNHVNLYFCFGDGFELKPTQIAGNAKSQFTRPKPQDANKASRSL